MTFVGMPLPPSSNNMYKSFMQRGRIRHVCSLETNAFKCQMRAYWRKESLSVKFAREAFAGHPLSVHIEFGFEFSRLLTKKGHFKKLDVSNRLKALHDSIAEALLIDDSCFVCISATKYAVQKKEQEMASVTISLTEFVEYQ